MKRSWTLFEGTISVTRNKSVSELLTNNRLQNNACMFNVNTTGESCKAEVVLLTFCCEMKYDQVLEEMAERKLRPADFCELVAFAGQHPEETEQMYGYAIFGLGSTYRLETSKRLAPALCAFRHEEKGCLAGEYDDFAGIIRFLAVRD